MYLSSTLYLDYDGGSTRRESWTIKKAEHRRVDAFELKCWRRLLRVPGLQGDPTSPS